MSVIEELMERLVGYEFPLKSITAYLGGEAIQKVTRIVDPDGNCWEVINGDDDYLIIQREGKTRTFDIDEKVVAFSVLDPKTKELRCFQANEKGQMILMGELPEKKYTHL